MVCENKTGRLCSDNLVDPRPRLTTRFLLGQMVFYFIRCELEFVNVEFFDHGNNFRFNASVNVDTRFIENSISNHLEDTRVETSDPIFPQHF